MSNQRQIVIKLLINEEKNRVVFAESDGNFVDVLLSFLTLPIGTVIRLLKSQSTIGSIDNLYKSIVNLDKKHLRTEECLDMLIRPRNAYENFFRPHNLDITIDDSQCTKFYICRSGNCGNDWVSPINKCFMISYSTCPCGSSLFLERGFPPRSGGYVNGTLKYIITDDLQVMPVFTTSATFDLLKEYGVKESGSLAEQTIHLGPAEVLLLLKHALLSKGPLTDVILNNPEATPSNFSEPKARLETHNTTSEPPNSTMFISLKLMVCKSSNKILYAEAGPDFVDFVFNFLTFPLGAVIKLLGENSSLGCIDNLYKSVKDIPFDDKLSEICRKMFLDPKLPQHVKCSSQLLNIEEEGSFRLCGRQGYLNHNIISDISCHDECKQTPVVLNAINPKLRPLGTTSGGGFMNDDLKCMVTDSLEVKPLSPINVISMLKVLNVQLHDIEEQVVLVREKEGLKLLKAALTSNTVLNDVFG